MEPSLIEFSDRMTLGVEPKRQNIIDGGTGKSEGIERNNHHAISVTESLRRLAADRQRSQKLGEESHQFSTFWRGTFLGTY